MKRIVSLSLLAACTFAVFAETADAGLFRRRRCRSCSTCNSCNSCAPGGQAAMPGGQMYAGQDPNAPYGQAPQYGQPQQSGAFYRGQDNAPMTAPGIAPPQRSGEVQGTFGTQGTTGQGTLNTNRSGAAAQGSLGTQSGSGVSGSAQGSASGNGTGVGASGSLGTGTND